MMIKNDKSAIGAFTSHHGTAIKLHLLMHGIAPIYTQLQSKTTKGT